MKKKDGEATGTKAKAPEKPKMLGSKEVADMLGVAPAVLRRWLRSQGKGTNDDQGRYEWAPDSKELNKLKTDFQAWQKEQEKPKEDKGKEKKGSKKGSSKKKGQGEEEEEDTEELG